jgi:hypothetical protein
MYFRNFRRWKALHLFGRGLDFVLTWIRYILITKDLHSWQKTCTRDKRLAHIVTKGLHISWQKTCTRDKRLAHIVTKDLYSWQKACTYRDKRLALVTKGLYSWQKLHISWQKTCTRDKRLALVTKGLHSWQKACTRDKRLAHIVTNTVQYGYSNSTPKKHYAVCQFFPGCWGSPRSDSAPYSCV